LFAPCATAQDYRGRVQGTVLDSTQSALPGTTITMVNDATGVAVTFVADQDGHYIFDFVDPGVYTISGELQGCKKSEQRHDRDTTITGTLSNENRPYHHAYANDYDAGGGTRRANDVLLDGVALGASYKTAYTPAVDAVDEITISKNSVDAENGHSLGGVISLN